jgi:hypothetical protein
MMIVDSTAPLNDAVEGQPWYKLQWNSCMSRIRATRGKGAVRNALARPTL